MRFAYADPPYPGLSARYYRNEPTFAGEVDHAALVASLEASNYDGWALSTGAYALRDILPLCPEGAKVCPWVKPIGVPNTTRGLHNTWEPLIVVRGRERQPGMRDWLRAQPARGGGSLPGRKPLAFCAWLFDCLGMLPGDELVDLFPGTGVVGRAWLSLSAESYASPAARANGLAGPGAADDDACRAAPGDASSRARSDASGEYLGDGALGADAAGSRRSPAGVAPGRQPSSAHRGGASPEYSRDRFLAPGAFDAAPDDASGEDLGDGALKSAGGGTHG